MRYSTYTRLAGIVLLSACLAKPMGPSQRGQNSQAREVLGKALAMAKERYVCRFIVASAYAELRENEKAFESLDQAFLQRST